MTHTMTRMAVGAVVCLVSAGQGAGQTPAPSGAGGPCSVAAPAAAPPLPVELPFALLNNHVHVEVCHGLRPLSFVLDTGAPMSILDLNVSRQLGIPPQARMQARGAGASMVDAARLGTQRVVIPGAGVAVPIDTAIDFSGITSTEGTPIDGVLGADFIRRFVVEVDYHQQRLTLHDPTAFKYDGTGEAVPITFLGNYIQTRASLSLADGTDLDALLLVDVGSSLGLALAQPFVEAHGLRARVGPTVRRPMGRGVGGVTTADVGRIESLRLGDVVIRRPVTGLHHADGGVLASTRQGDGNLGADILRRFVVYLDYARSRLILERHAGTDEPFETDMSGLSFSLQTDGAGLVVDFVVPESPAAVAGIQPGDVITQIDGRPVTRATPSPLKERFRRQGQRVTLSVSRRGVVQTVSFTTRRLT